MAPTGAAVSHRLNFIVELSSFLLLVVVNVPVCAAVPVPVPVPVPVVPVVPDAAAVDVHVCVRSCIYSCCFRFSGGYGSMIDKCRK